MKPRLHVLSGVLALIALALLWPSAVSKAQSLTELRQPLQLWMRTVMTNQAGNAVDAVGEFSGVAGHMFLQGGSPKTCSTSGCHILFDLQTVTAWANAGTTVRAGIQDISETDGQGDGTFDVYADLVPGTETLTAASMRFAMESGTKTISQNDVVVLQLTMTARGGTDSITPDGQQRFSWVSSGFPYGVRNASGSSSKNQIVTKIMIEFDDGSYGWIVGNPTVAYTQSAGTSTTFGNASTPDEYAAVGDLPFDCNLRSITYAVDDNVDGEDWEYILYLDPTGTPTIPSGGTIAMDSALTNVFSGFAWASGRFSTAQFIPAGTTFAMAIRPTTANTITIHNETVSTSSSATATAYKAAAPLHNLVWSSRSNQTGAFAAVGSPAVGVPSMGFYCDEVVQ